MALLLRKTSRHKYGRLANAHGGMCGHDPR